MYETKVNAYSNVIKNNQWSYKSDSCWINQKKVNFACNSVNENFM